MPFFGSPFTDALLSPKHILQKLSFSIRTFLHCVNKPSLKAIPLQPFLSTELDKNGRQNFALTGITGFSLITGFFFRITVTFSKPRIRNSSSTSKLWRKAHSTIHLFARSFDAFSNVLITTPDTSTDALNDISRFYRLLLGKYTFFLSNQKFSIFYQYNIILH